MAQLPYSVGSDGRITITQPPPLVKGVAQNNVPGGAINAASAKTLASLTETAEAAKALGAGQKGSSRRRRRRMRGGSQQNMNANPPTLPTANSMPGTSFADTHVKAIDNLNALRAGGVYDNLAKAPPIIKTAGGTRKRRNKSKKRKNGRRSKRTHRRIRH